MAVAMIGPKFYAWDNNGNPLAFGKLFTYQARTNIPKPTYMSEDQVVANSNPVILNDAGYADVYLDGSYKMVLKDENDVEIWTEDPVTAAQAQEWVSCQTTIYVSPTSLKIPGNLTNIYTVGRRVRIDNAQPEYAYSTIVSSVFAASETTITVSDAVILPGVQGICVSLTSSETSSAVDVKTVAAMVAREDLSLGQKVRWCGYHAEGDSGGNVGFVVPALTGTNDGGSFFDLNNGLQVQAIFSSDPTPAQFGAIPNTLSSISIFNNLFTYSSSVNLNSKTWILDGALVLASSRKYSIYDGELDFSNVAADGDLITLTGLGFSDNEDLTANSKYPDTQITVSDASAYSVDDVILIKSTAQWSVNTTASEFAVISNIAGGVITVEGCVLADYKTTDSAHIRKFDTGTSISLSDVSIIGNSSFNQTALNAKYHYNSSLNGNVYVRNCRRTAVLFESGVLCCNTGLLTVVNADQEGLGYALNTVGSQWCNFGDVTGINCRHVTTTGDSSGGETLARWQSYGNIIGNGSRDAIVDTHDGACDFTYNSIVGTLKFGNGADDGITMEGARIHISKAIISNVERFGLYVNFLGMGDTGRESFFTIDSCTVEGKTTGDYSALIQNVSGVLAHKLDSVVVNHITGNSERGILIEAEDGDISYLKINANIKTVTDHSIEINSLTGRVKDCDLSGVVDHGSSNTVHYPVFINGNTWSTNNGNAIATRANVSTRMINSGSAVSAIRNFSCDVNLYGYWFDGVYTTPIIDSGVGVTRKGDAQITKQIFSFNPGNILDGAEERTTVTVAGVAFGDFVDATWDEDPQGLEIFGFISAVNTVTIVFKNNTGGAVDLSTGNIIVRSN